MTSFYEKEKAEALDLQRQFADRAIMALWGGGSSSTNHHQKGHGFWLYPTRSREKCHEALDLAAKNNWSLVHTLGHKEVGPAIENDGKASGNVYFWMVPDAKKILAQGLTGFELWPGPAVVE